MSAGSPIIGAEKPVEHHITIEGVGGMVNIVDPTYYAGGKAAIVTGGQNIVLKNLDISGITVPDGNGAGVRYDQGTLLLVALQDGSLQLSFDQLDCPLKLVRPQPRQRTAM